MPSREDFNTGTRVHKERNRRDFREPAPECDTCAICGKTDVTEDGEWLDATDWVCYTCVQEVEEEVHEETSSDEE